MCMSEEGPADFLSEKKACLWHNGLCTRSREGFTLVETLVVVTIASLFLGLAFRFYSQSSVSQTQLIDGLQMRSSVVTGVNKILREIRTGTAFIFPGLDEDSPILIVADFENNHKAVYTLENLKASKLAGRKIYDLFVYTADTEALNLASPVHDAKKLRLLCSDIEKINFRLNSANSVSINLTFFKGNKEFQIVSEGSLMNSGDVK